MSSRYDLTSVACYCRSCIFFMVTLLGVLEWSPSRFPTITYSLSNINKRVVQREPYRHVKSIKPKQSSLKHSLFFHHSFVENNKWTLCQGPCIGFSYNDTILSGFFLYLNNYLAFLICRALYQWDLPFWISLQNIFKRA